jgi:hypothetical protein
MQTEVNGMKPKRWLVVGAVLGLTMFGLVGCMCPITPMPGLLVTAASYPHIQACTDGTLGQKTGESSAFTVLGIVCVGDASVERAARSSGITKIKTIDHRYLGILGFLFSQYTTIVTGE